MHEEENGSHQPSRNFLEGEGRRNGTSQGLVQVPGALWGFSHHSAFPCDWREPIAPNLVLGNATGEGRLSPAPHLLPNPSGGAWKGITSS